MLQNGFYDYGIVEGSIGRLEAPIHICTELSDFDDLFPKARVQLYEVATSSSTMCFSSQLDISPRPGRQAFCVLSVSVVERPVGINTPPCSPPAFEPQSNSTLDKH